MNSTAFDVKGACPHHALALQSRTESRGGVTEGGWHTEMTWESAQFDVGPQFFFQFALRFHQRFDLYGNVIAGFW
jgi:hypothetical protein